MSLCVVEIRERERRERLGWSISICICILCEVVDKVLILFSYVFCRLLSLHYCAYLFVGLINKRIQMLKCSNKSRSLLPIQKTIYLVSQVTSSVQLKIDIYNGYQSFVGN